MVLWKITFELFPEIRWNSDDVRFLLMWGGYGSPGVLLRRNASLDGVQIFISAHNSYKNSRFLKEQGICMLYIKFSGFMRKCLAGVPIQSSAIIALFNIISFCIWYDNG